MIYSEVMVDFLIRKLEDGCVLIVIKLGVKEMHVVRPVF